MTGEEKRLVGGGDLSKATQCVSGWVSKKPQ